MRTLNKYFVIHTYHLLYVRVYGIIQSHQRTEEKRMRFIDRTGKKHGERGESRDVKRLGSLTREATMIAEERNLGVLKTSHGPFRIIRESGLGGACDKDFSNLGEVDAYLRNL